MMSTHPQPGKSGSLELQNAYAQKCGRTPYAVGNISQIFPLSRKFARIVSDIFVSQAIVHMQNSTIAKLDMSQNLTSFLSIKTLTRLIRPISPHIKVFSSIVLLPILVLLSGDRCRDGSCLPRPQRYCQTKDITKQGEIVHTGSAARS